MCNHLNNYILLTKELDRLRNDLKELSADYQSIKAELAETLDVSQETPVTNRRCTKADDKVYNVT